MDSKLAILEVVVDDPSCVLRWVTDEISRLPEELRPTELSRWERPKRHQVHPLSDRKVVREHLSACGGGFFLRGRKFKYEVNLGVSDASITLWIDQGDTRLLSLHKELFMILEPIGYTYGFSSSWSEYCHRNEYKFKFSDGGSSTSFVGRAHKRYVPGLYWVNYFSDEYRDAMSLSLENIAAQSQAILTRLQRGTILRIYDRPVDWISNIETIDDVVFATPGFFSKRRIELPPNLSRLSEFSLKRHWP